MPRTVNEAAQLTRAFQMALDINASPGDVWRALTEAGELVRWFPMDARVTPGVGGSMAWSWGEGYDWESRIEAWEPGRLLRLIQEDARPYDAQGRPLPAAQAEPARIAMEFTLETHQGKTRLRLVHSGFGHGAAWDNELEGISEGWQAELRSLRHYLERHRGRDRHFGRAWLTTTTSRDAAWARLLGPGGYRVNPPEPVEGQPYEVTTPDGQRYTGTIELYLPRQTLAGTVRQLDDGWFRLLTWKDGKGDTGVWAWVASYSGDDQRVREFRDQGQRALQRLFPS
jgi:uncharacterized protein YndB with AHSA1/START domain